MITDLLTLKNRILASAFQKPDAVRTGCRTVDSCTTQYYEAEQAAMYLPCARPDILPHAYAGHVPFLDQPDDFCRLMKSFIAKR
ncbi:hypothetical protein GCM10028803_04330 [Larkinella knui]|uniref:Alpha/beta hydrolase n=1 Tax=Larkinella knui TaxID=2025310 RepID=A0A3P1CKS4_9BACT|nr:hypothetical protein [Larkinella knui]RRB13885.1 hypothetical protein EHT87_16645 [Larkinella knui]